MEKNKDALTKSIMIAGEVSSAAIRDAVRLKEQGQYDGFKIREAHDNSGRRLRKKLGVKTGRQWKKLRKAAARAAREKTP